MSKTEKMCDQLLRVRTSLGKTQAEMADLLGVSRNYIYLIEKEKESAGPKFQRKLNALESKNIGKESQLELSERNVDDDWRKLDDAELKSKISRAVLLGEWAAVSEVSLELQRRKITKL